MSSHALLTIAYVQVEKKWLESQATSTYRLRNPDKKWNQPWLALDGTDANPQGLLCEPVTVYTSRQAHGKKCFVDGQRLLNSFYTFCLWYSRPSGFMEFDITEAMRNWQYGQPNYGVLLLATNEDALGRDIRFFSNADSVSSRHAYINVLCD